MRVEGLGFRVLGFGFEGLGFRVECFSIVGREGCPTTDPADTYPANNAFPEGLCDSPTP